MHRDNCVIKLIITLSIPYKTVLYKKMLKCD